MSHTDRIYTEAQAVAPFAFDARVAAVFPDMIRRSVPGYNTIVAVSGSLAEKYAQPQSNLYDLGTSLGATALSLQAHTRAAGCTIHAIDTSADMLAKARAQQEQDHELVSRNETTPIQWLQQDILDTKLERASLVCLNFTLQFIPLEQRSLLIERIAAATLPGGALILSEKVQVAEPDLHTTLTDLHHTFKSQQGYSDLEIEQKRQSLENVLVPETTTTHEARLHAAGYTQIVPWFRCFQFVSWLAIKE